MTGRPFLPALLGTFAALAVEIAFGANLADVTGASWVWTDVTAYAQHNPGMPLTIGRADNVSQAPAAALSVTLKNDAGRYTVGGPNDAGMAQNLPVRERITLDGTTWRTRFQGYLDTANPVYDQSATVKKVQVKAYGALARIGGQKKPLRSALYRQSTKTPNLIGYWPLDDGAATTTPANVVAGGSAMRAGNPVGGFKGSATTPVSYGVDGPVGGAGAVDLSNGGYLTAAARTQTAEWTVSFVCKIIGGVTQVPPPPPGSGLTQGTIDVFKINTVGGGTYRFSYINDGLNDGFSFMKLDYDNPNAAFAFTTSQFAGEAFNDGQFHLVQVAAFNFGGNGLFTTQVDGNDIENSRHILIGAGDLVQPVTSVTMGETSAFGDSIDRKFAISNVLVADGTNPGGSPVSGYPVAWNYLDMISASAGWLGETASARLIRLCAELGIALDIRGTSTIAMGVQGVDARLNLLRDCEAADHGLMYDGFGPGIGYQCRTARYNAPAALTLDMGAPRQVETFLPVFDRQAVVNQWTVTRKGGASAVYEQATGPLGTATIGVEDKQTTINIADDGAVPSHAQFLVSLGIMPGYRYPGVGLNLLNIPSKAAALLALKPGDRVSIVNPASKATDLPAATIDLIAEGWGESSTADTHGMALNCSPFRPWRVFQLDADKLDDPNVGLAL